MHIKRMHEPRFLVNAECTGPGRRWRWLLAGLLLALATLTLADEATPEPAAPSAPAAAPEVAQVAPALPSSAIYAAPIFERQVTPQGTQGRALGPFFAWQSGNAGERFFALRPLFSYLSEPARAMLTVDFLWPFIYGYRAVGETTNHQGLLVFMQGSGDETRRNAEQFILFPIYAQGLTMEGESFHALFPIYGTVRNLFGVDMLRFALFPLWLEARKGDTVSRNWL